MEFETQSLINEEDDYISINVQSSSGIYNKPQYIQLTVWSQYSKSG